MSNGWDGADPVQQDDGAGTFYELGEVATINGDLTVTAVRVWHGANSNTVTNRRARIWTTGGAIIEEITLDDVLAPGWTTYPLASPLERTAGSQLLVSYSTRQFYGATAGEYPNASADGLVTYTDGRFATSVASFPTTDTESFYGVDLVYDAGIGGNVAPVVTLAVTMVGLTATALASVVDEAPASVTYRFVWGDGETTSTSSATANHTYPAPGTYAVLVVATDSAGLTGTAAVPVLARRIGPGGLRLSEVAAEIATRLDSIDGLRCFSYPPATIHPPVAVVLNPTPGDIEYDQTYVRGLDRMTLPLIVLAGRGNERAATKNIRPYLDGAGEKSVKAALESGTYATFDTIRVTTGGVDGVVWGGTEYQAALFDLDIAGSGS